LNLRGVAKIQCLCYYSWS